MEISGTRISQLPEAISASSTDHLVIDRNDNTKKIEVNNLMDSYLHYAGYVNIQDLQDLGYVTSSYVNDALTAFLYDEDFGEAVCSYVSSNFSEFASNYLASSSIEPVDAYLEGYLSAHGYVPEGGSGGSDPGYVTEEYLSSYLTEYFPSYMSSYLEYGGGYTILDGMSEYLPSYLTEYMSTYMEDYFDYEYSADRTHLNSYLSYYLDYYFNWDYQYDRANLNFYLSCYLESYFTDGDGVRYLSEFLDDNLPSAFGAYCSTSGFYDDMFYFFDNLEEFLSGYSEYDSMYFDIFDGYGNLYKINLHSMFSQFWDVNDTLSGNVLSTTELVITTRTSEKLNYITVDDLVSYIKSQL